MKRILIILIVILILAVPTGIAGAAGYGDKIVARGETLDEDVVLYGESLSVEEGGTVNGDVVVFGGSADVDGSVSGDVSLFGGSMNLSGTVDGDVVLFGGSLDIAESAVIAGDCVIVGGSVATAAGSAISCANPTEAIPFVENFSPPVPPPPIDTPVIRVPDRTNGFVQFFRDLGEAIGSTVTAGLFALVVASVFPQQLARVEAAIRQKPAASGTVGLLTGVATLSLGTILTVISAILVIACVGFLGFPIVFVMALLLGAGVVMGWIALGKMFGEWLTERLKISQSSAVTAATLGTIALTFLLTFLRAVPFVFGTDLIIFILASVGLGAAALTKFGTRPYPLMAAHAGGKVDDVLATMAVDEEG